MNFDPETCYLSTSQMLNFVGRSIVCMYRLWFVKHMHRGFQISIFLVAFFVFLRKRFTQFSPPPPPHPVKPQWGALLQYVQL